MNFSFTHLAKRAPDLSRALRAAIILPFRILPGCNRHPSVKVRHLRQHNHQQKRIVLPIVYRLTSVASLPPLLLSVDAGDEVGGLVDLAQTVVHSEVPRICVRHLAADVSDDSLRTPDGARIPAGVVVASADQPVALVLHEILFVSSVDCAHGVLLSPRLPGRSGLFVHLLNISLYKSWKKLLPVSFL